MTYFRFPGDDESRYETRADAEADFRFFTDREPEANEIEEVSALTPATNDSLARAIESLGAVEVAPGKYAFPNSGFWFTCCLERVGKRRFKQHGIRLMPTWWKPEQRVVRRIHWDDGVTQTGPAIEISRYPHTIVLSERITADLETGEEVPA